MAKRKKSTVKQNFFKRVLANKLASVLLFGFVFGLMGLFVVRSFAAPEVPNLTTQLPAAEGSGLVASKQYPGVFWWNRDGGQASKPRDAVYAMKMDNKGNLLPVRDTNKFPYVLFADGTTSSTIYNKQWEDIALDDENNLWIGNIGANPKSGDPDGCGHSQQKIYKIKEPNPTSDTRTGAILAQYTFTFPDPPAGCLTYNSEAMFWLDGKMYIVAKKSNSPVYRIDFPAGNTGTAKLTLIGNLPSGISNISYSSVSTDKKRLMVGGHGGFKVLTSSNSTLVGDAWVKDIISRAFKWNAVFSCTPSCKTTSEGGAFFNNSYNTAFVSETSWIYFATPAMYGDNTEVPVADTTPPNLSIVSPVNGATIAGSAYQVKANVTDNVGVKAVSLRVDDRWIATTTAAPYTFSLDTTQLAKGTHSIAVVGWDAANNSREVSVTVNVDNSLDTTPPAVTITAPLNGSRVAGVINVTASATDVKGVSSLEAKVDGVVYAQASSDTLSFNWDTAVVSAGTHTILVTAKDVSGNTGTRSISVTK